MLTHSVRELAESRQMRDCVAVDVDGGGGQGRKDEMWLGKIV